MEKPVSGLAKKLQESLKHHTGKRHPIKVGTEAAGEEEEGAAAGAATGAQASVGAGAAVKGAAEATVGEAEAEAKTGRKRGPFEIKGSVGEGGKNQQRRC